MNLYLDASDSDKSSRKKSSQVVQVLSWWGELLTIWVVLDTPFCLFWASVFLPYKMRGIIHISERCWGWNEAVSTKIAYLRVIHVILLGECLCLQEGLSQGPFTRSSPGPLCPFLPRLLGNWVSVQVQSPAFALRHCWPRTPALTTYSWRAEINKGPTSPSSLQVWVQAEERESLEKRNSHFYPKLIGESFCYSLLYGNQISPCGTQTLQSQWHFQELVALHLHRPGACVRLANTYLSFEIHLGINSSVESFF